MFSDPLSINHNVENPLGNVSLTSEAASPHLRNVRFEPELTFNAFARLLIDLSENLQRPLSSLDSNVGKSNTNVEMGLISKGFQDVGYIFVDFDKVLENRNIKVPNIIEYTNSTFDGVTLTTEPRVSLQKICDYLSDFLRVFSEREPIIDKLWNRNDITELLYLLGADITNEPLFSQIDQRFTSLATGANATLSGRNKETKKELWNTLEELLSDGLKYQIKDL